MSVGFGLDASFYNNTMSRHRCFCLGCDYATGMPSSMAAIECKGGCGIIFCSTDCMQSHHKYGHHLSCQHIRQKARNNNNSTISRQREETPEQVALAKATIQKNESWPTVVWQGRAFTRRFRPGQRIEANVGGFQPGTIVKLAFQQTEDQLLAYEIESDTGMYCSASLDNDDFVRRLPGAPVIGDPKLPIKDDMLTAVVREFQNWMPLCQEARADASTVKGPPSVDRYRCSDCGKISKTKLQACSRCKTVAYCNPSCQKHDWQEHKEACKSVAKGREEFLAKLGSMGTKRERKKALRHGSRARLQWETLQTFLEDCGLPWGGANFLRNTVNKASAASESPDGTVAMRRLVETHYDGHEIGSTMSELVITTENLVRLVAGVLHFFEKAPDIASYCAAGVDLSLRCPRSDLFSPLLTRPEMKWQKLSSK